MYFLQVIKSLKLLLVDMLEKKRIILNLGYVASIKEREKVKKDLIKYRKSYSEVNFDGEEPTIRKDFHETIKYAKNLGYENIGVTTSGGMFVNLSFVKSTIEAGLNFVVFSVHGHNAKIHDSITGVKGSFKKILKGIENLRGYPEVDIYTTTLITKLNYKFLSKITEKNISIGANSCEFIFVNPKGNVLKDFDKIVPTFKEVSVFVPKIIDIAKTNNVEIQIGYFPNCYILGFERYFNKPEILLKMGEQNIELIKGPQCKICDLNDVCKGIFKEYAKRRGFDELIPIPSQ